MGRFLDILWSDESFFGVFYGPMSRFWDVVWCDGSFLSITEKIRGCHLSRKTIEFAFNGSEKKK